MQNLHDSLKVLGVFGFYNPKQVRIIKSEPRVKLKEKKKQGTQE